MHVLLIGISECFPDCFKELLGILKNSFSLHHAFDHHLLPLQCCAPLQIGEYPYDLGVLILKFIFVALHIHVACCFKCIQFGHLPCERLWDCHFRHSPLSHPLLQVLHWARLWCWAWCGTGLFLKVSSSCLISSNILINLSHFFWATCNCCSIVSCGCCCCCCYSC